MSVFAASRPHSCLQTGSDTDEDFKGTCEFYLVKSKSGRKHLKQSVLRGNVCLVRRNPTFIRYVCMFPTLRTSTDPDKDFYNLQLLTKSFKYFYIC